MRAQHVFFSVKHRKMQEPGFNMQDAFFQEKGKVGGWVEIGYSAPGTGSSTSYASNVFTYTGSADGAAPATWTATPKQKLNDCTTSGKWSLKAENKGTATDNMYPSFEISDNSTTDVCKSLTASWDNLTGSH